MTGTQLATLSTIGWVILTLAILVVFGTWSTGEGWSILPGIVRGVRDWATEQVAARQPTRPSPWAVPRPDPRSKPASFVSGGQEPEAFPEIEELWERPTQR